MTLSPDAKADVDKVHTAFQKVRDAQISEGPTPDVKTRLIRLGQLDQAGRNVIQMLDLSALPADHELMFPHWYGTESTLRKQPTVTCLKL